MEIHPSKNLCIKMITIGRYRRERKKNGFSFKCVICSKILRKGLFCKEHSEKNFKTMWYGGFKYDDDSHLSLQDLKLKSH